MTTDERAIKMHRAHQGKLDVVPSVPLETMDDLALAYTPGVAAVCRQIADNPSLSRELTVQGRSVAVVTDGSAVLGLGNIGPKAALPVMEGKAAIFKRFGGIDAYPLCLATQDTEEIIAVVTAIAPGFAGINLEDISAPRCFEIEERLIEALDIPVLHDDQHGTAVVVLAGLINACRATGKELTALKVAIAGAGAAGIATASLLRRAGVKVVRVCDSRGMLLRGRDGMNPYKDIVAGEPGAYEEGASCADGVVGADVFVGVSGPNTMSVDQIRSMAADPIVFALSNPVPEIMPDEAYRGGAAVVATGRSDFPNQVNNALAFPGLFRGAIDARLRRFTPELLLRVADTLASCVENPTREAILPNVLDPRVPTRIAETVRLMAEQGEDGEHGESAISLLG